MKDLHSVGTTIIYYTGVATEAVRTLTDDVWGSAENVSKELTYIELLKPPPGL